MILRVASAKFFVVIYANNKRVRWPILYINVIFDIQARTHRDRADSMARPATKAEIAAAREEILAGRHARFDQLIPWGEQADSRRTRCPQSA